MRLAPFVLVVAVASCAPASPPPPPAPTPPAPIECTPGRTAKGDHCVPIDDDCRPGEKLQRGVGCVREGAVATPEPADSAPARPSIPGLDVEDLVTGTGPVARAGDNLVLHYVGTLQDGREFDSSRKRAPFRFKLGSGIIKGWEQGLGGMRVGGKRRLTISPELAYGDRGRPPVIPARAVLIFEIELLAVE